MDDDSVFSGVDGPRCPRAPDNARPQAFLINKGSASGVFQDDFKNGEVQHSQSTTPTPTPFNMITLGGDGGDADADADTDADDL